MVEVYCQDCGKKRKKVMEWKGYNIFGREVTWIDYYCGKCDNFKTKEKE